MFSPWNTRIKPHFGSSYGFVLSHRPDKDPPYSPKPPLGCVLSEREDEISRREMTGNPTSQPKRSRNHWFQVGAAPARECLA